MPLINGSLQIGRSGLSAAQAALSVTGNNIANAATASYSRQTVHLAPTQYSEVQAGRYTGTGVTIYDIRRSVDNALNARLRSAVSDSESNLVLQQAMTRVEAAYNELTDSDISTRLNAFFTAWSDLQKEPTNAAVRETVLQEAGGLTSRLRTVRSELSEIQLDLDAQVRVQTNEINTLLSQVAELNARITSTEAGKINSASALRDQRDELLRDLSQLIDIRTQETESGAITVYVGSDPAVQHADAREVGYVEQPAADGTMLADIVFTDKNQSLDLTSGRLHGMIEARDNHVGAAIADLDTWTSNLILEVNKIHSTGQSLEGRTSVTSFFNVDDTTASLADTTDNTGTGLPWAATNGIFWINVYNSDGTESTARIDVKIGVNGQTDTTLESLRADLDAVAGINASIDASNHLRIDAANAGSTFKLSGYDPDNPNDTSNALAILGINTFFEGSTANDIAVKSDLSPNPNFIAAGATGDPGNGAVAADISKLDTTAVAAFNGLSLAEQFAAYISQVGSNSKEVQDNYIAADVVVQTLESERQAISGVSTDEEAIHMIMFQRAFQGSARYISLIDQLLDEVIALAG